MRGDARRRLVRRLDALFFAGLLITSGLAALLFWLEFYEGDEDDEPVAQVSTATLTHTPAVTHAQTSTATPTATATSSKTPPPTLTLTATNTLTATATATPRPGPDVAPLALADTYAGESLVITGEAEPGDTIQVYDRNVLVAEVEAGEDGGWMVELPDGLAAGPHALSAVAVGPDGVVSAAVPIGFQIGDAPTFTPTQTPTATQTATVTPTASFTATSTATVTPTATPTATVTATPLPSPTVGPSATNTPTVTPTRTMTSTATTTPISIPTTATATAVAVVATATATATSTLSPTPSQTATTTRTPTLTPSPSVTSSPEPPTRTPSVTPSYTPTTTVRPSVTPSLTVTATITPTPTVPAIRPRIDRPESGAVLAPGTIVVQGAAQPGVTIEVQDATTGVVLVTSSAAAGGTWQGSVELGEAGSITLVAVAVGPDGAVLVSEPVTITLAPPVQPDTGGAAPNPAERGRAFTALIALLLAAGGFSLYFAGRLIFLLAHERPQAR